MENEFMAEVRTEAPAFEEEPKEKDTPTESPTEKKPEEESPSSQGEQTNTENEEDNVPFHKHPRWKEIYEENKNLKENVEELRQFKDSVEQRLSKMDQPKDSSTAPEWITEGFGENEQIKEKFQRYEEELENKIVDRIYKRNQEEQMKAQQAQKKAEEFVSSQLQELRDDGKTFDRNELLKIAMEYTPSDDEGNIDLRKAYAIMESIKPKDNGKSKARKEIADQTTSSPKGESEPKGYVTSNDLRNKSWTRLVD